MSLGNWIFENVTKRQKLTFWDFSSLDIEMTFSIDVYCDGKIYFRMGSQKRYDSLNL